MEIHVTNFSDGEIVPHSLIVLRGSVISPYNEIQELTLNIISDNECQKSNWTLFKNQFTILARLTFGSNKIVLHCETVLHQLTLFYTPLKLDRFVRLVYILCSDSYGRFQSPKGEPNTIESACQRISFGAEMIQAFVAEELRRHTLGRKTFNLECNEKGRPICHVFRLSVTLKDARNLSEKQMWTLVAEELMNSLLGDARCKFLAFLSFTQYANPNLIEPAKFEDVVSLTKNYVSLGGGGLALLGTACLHTWPQNDDEIQHRLTDMRVIDQDYLMDHSNYRGYYWACYATTLGAACHELGHTFDLGHTSEGIMGRGFNDFNRAFMDMKCIKEECCQNKAHISGDLRTPINSKVSRSRMPSKVAKSAQLVTSNLKDRKKSFTKPEDSLLDGGCCEVNFGNCCFLNHLKSSQAVLDRSSAFMLFFHKWFNPSCENNCKDLTLNRNILSSSCGIRVVEIRETTRSVLFSKVYEDNGHTEVDLRNLGFKLPANSQDSQYLVVAEDSYGNLLRENVPKEFFLNN